jgi:hypothetical protein
VAARSLAIDEALAGTPGAVRIGPGGGAVANIALVATVVPTG